MNHPWTRKSWSPYIVGVGIGLLSWFAFATADHPLGISTSFEYTAALIGKAIVPNLVEMNEYFTDVTPRIGWEWMLVVGVFGGSLLSSWLSGDREPSTVPSYWQKRFGGSVALRLAAAFLGGGLMMFGARLAGGCTSGHGISGNLQLAASSWLFSVVFFATAVLTAFVVFGKGAIDHV